MTGTAASPPRKPAVEICDDGLAFECPRCATAVIERLYGPCQACRRQLVESLRGESRQVDVARFEPVMHVTPNAVATKD